MVLNFIKSQFVCLFVLRFYGPVNPIKSQFVFCFISLSLSLSLFFPQKIKLDILFCDRSGNYQGPIALDKKSIQMSIFLFLHKIML